MTSKRIFKFALRILVVVLIVVGAFYLIKSITDKKNSNNLIANCALQNNLQQKTEQSTDGLLEKVGDNRVAYAIINNCKTINGVLVEYYNYYVNLTGFENAPDDSMQQQILKDISNLSKKIDNTIELLNQAKNPQVASKTEEVAKRVRNTTLSYIKQTEMFFNLDNLLKQYVYKINYQTDCTGSVYEAQLEMAKDYCFVAFTNGIKGHYDDSGIELILTSGEDSSFSSVIKKFNNRQKNNVNGDKELKFATNYYHIDATELTKFYSYNDAGKNGQINTMVASDVADTKLMGTYLKILYEYICQGAY